MKIGSLFSGIGGFDLAARWVGWDTAWYSEIDPYAAAVMAKHFPGVVNLGDVTAIDGLQIPHVDLLCGGFPCQDISLAGKGGGLNGERSGLWRHYARLIAEIQPRWVVIENVAALRARGLDQVLGEIAALGYDAEWHCIPAAYVGAPHRRDRIWIVARQWPADGSVLGDSGSERLDRGVDGCGLARSGEVASEGPVDIGNASSGNAVANANSAGCGERRRSFTVQTPLIAAECDCETLANAESGRLAVCGRASRETGHLALSGQGVADADRTGHAHVCEGEARRGLGSDDARRHATGASHLTRRPPAERWPVEPNVGRVAYGIPNRVDRLRCLGNALVPQIAVLLFRAIQEVERRELAVAA